MKGIQRIPDQCMVSFAKGERCPYFEGWFQKRDDMQEENGEPEDMNQTDLRTSLEFLRCCNTSLDILKDAGFESAMRYLAKHCMDLALVSIMSHLIIVQTLLILFDLSALPFGCSERFVFVFWCIPKQ